MKLTHCRVNHLENPMGYAFGIPTFSWVLDADTEPVRPLSEMTGNSQAETAQTVFRLQVMDAGKTVYDSGFAGLDPLGTRVPLKLQPRTRYFWSVTAQMPDGQETAGDLQWFETGKMEEPWQAAWIGCDASEPRHPVFETQFCMNGEVREARLYICGLGLYEACFNGVKIDAELLTPYCNNYDAFVQAQSYDVTDLLKAAQDRKGTLSVLLGNGWYKSRFGFDAHEEKGYYGEEWKLIAELHIRYADGTETVIGTGPDWQVRRSGITFSGIYDGEQINEMLPELPVETARITEAPRGTLMDRLSTPVLVRAELPVKEVIVTPKGETVLDIGQNLTGFFRLRIREAAGTRIHLQFGEILQDGCFYRDNLRTAKAEYIFVTDGTEQTIEPHFTFYGYRYVKLEGLSQFEASDFTALHLYSELPRSGWIATGNPLVNQLIHNAEWGHLDNYLDVPTDCPQRDERMGWTGDAQVFAETACFQRDSYAFLSKYLYDMATEQAAHGGEVPMVVPAFGHSDSSSAWGDAACIIPWTLYGMYGDKSILENQYEAMRGWVEFIRRTEGENHGWRSHFHFGDWLALDGPRGTDGVEGGTDKGYIAAVYYLKDVRILAKTAAILGKQEDAEAYEHLAEQLLGEIRDEYFSPLGRCCIPTQTGLLLALAEGIAPEPQRIARELVEKIRVNEGDLATGFVGTPILCPTLTEIGEEKMAFDLLLNEEYPGWLYAVKMGATTIWERWNSVLPNGKISGIGMNSLNHYAYGSIVSWLYKDVAGIKAAEPGFRRVTLKPHLSTALGKCTMRYESASGLWESSWEILPDEKIQYRCRVPYGCKAHLELPYGGGTYELSAGIYETTYIPDTQIRIVYSTDTAISEMLKSPRVRSVLTRVLPEIDQVPASMRGMSIRQLSVQMGQLDDHLLATLDEELAKL